jgi:hypothetical protein
MIKIHTGFADSQDIEEPCPHCTDRYVQIGLAAEEQFCAALDVCEAEDRKATKEELDLLEKKASIAYDKMADLICDNLEEEE